MELLFGRYVRNHFLRFHKIDDSRISLELLLDTCSVIIGFQVVSYVYLEGMPVQVFPRYSSKRRVANIRDVVSSSWSFRFCWRAPNSLDIIYCSSCYSWKTACFLIAIYTCLSHTSHTCSHSCKCRNSDEETLADEHAEYFSSSMHKL